MQSQKIGVLVIKKTVKIKNVNPWLLNVDLNNWSVIQLIFKGTARFGE